MEKFTSVLMLREKWKYPMTREIPKKEHKHKWYKTTLMANDPERESKACKCGSWEVKFKKQK